MTASWPRPSLTGNPGRRRADDDDASSRESFGSDPELERSFSRSSLQRLADEAGEAFGSTPLNAPSPAAIFKPLHPASPLPGPALRAHLQEAALATSAPGVAHKRV